ncbi:MAG: DUF885 domain-containing protein [Gammaproteobacteria bacterium]|nr:DUF885 domain-containing protein [Gammaproteobacteria bacterium]
MSGSEEIALAEKTASGIDAVAVSAVDVLFDGLCQQYYNAWYRYHPEQAVDIGIYDYAEHLRGYEHDDIGALLVLNQKMLSALDELNMIELSGNRQLEFNILKGAISIELHDMEENDWRYRDPMGYVPVNAIYQLMIHPGDNVQRAIKHRLEKIPDYLRGAKVMLSRYPERVVPQWTQTAAELSRSGADFVRGLARHPLITEKFSNPARLQPLFDVAAAALKDFSTYLETEVLAQATGRFAAGQNRFNRLLNDRHFLATDAEKILRFGERLLKQAEVELLQHSEHICGEPDVSKALEKVRAEHPHAEQLLGGYRKRIQLAFARLLKSDIISIPEKQSLKVQQTPTFMRDMIPFATYQPPSPQDDKQSGLYYVTPVEDESLLAEHDPFSIDLTSARETFPGRHLQFVIANKGYGNNATRLLNASASLYQGWAAYCEQLVFEQGLYDKEEHRFIMLRDRLWHGLKIIIDVKIHTGQLSFDEAVQLLVDKLGFDRSQAKAEINCYTRSAATPLCYAVGCEIILKTREFLDVSDKPELKVFHDALLSQGSIALPLVIQSVFGKEVWQSVHDEIFIE